MEPYVSLGEQSPGPVLCAPWSSESLSSLNPSKMQLWEDLPQSPGATSSFILTRALSPPKHPSQPGLLDELLYQPVDEWWASQARLQSHLGRFGARAGFGPGGGGVK